MNITAKLLGAALLLKGRTGIALALAAILVGGTDAATIKHYTPAACDATSIAVKVPNRHIAGLDSLIGKVMHGPKLSDVIAEKRPDVSLSAVVKGNGKMGLTPTGRIPRAFGGVQCIKVGKAGTVSKAGAEPAPDSIAGDNIGNVKYDLDSIKGKRKLTPREVAMVAHAGGFRGQKLILATVVALAESHGDTKARCYNNGNGCDRNPSARTKSTDRGLWQINDRAHPDVSTDEADNPVLAARAAFRISHGGKNFGPWATYNHRTRNAEWPTLVANATAAVAQL